MTLVTLDPRRSYLFRIGDVSSGIRLYSGRTMGKLVDSFCSLQMGFDNGRLHTHRSCVRAPQRGRSPTSWPRIIQPMNLYANSTKDCSASGPCPQCSAAGSADTLRAQPNSYTRISSLR